MSKFFSLRWRFDFVDKPTKVGFWNKPGKNGEGEAWSSNGSGLVRAAVEAKDHEGGAVKVLAECDGHDFINFQWMAIAFAGSFLKDGKDMVPTTKLNGMKLLTREKEFQVFNSGLVKVVDRTDKDFNFATFGR